MFTVANGSSTHRQALNDRPCCSPSAPKRGDLVLFVAPPCIKGLRLVTARLPEKSSPIGPGLNQLPLYGVLGSLGASGRAQTSSKSFGSSFLKKGSIEERLRSADERPPAARKSRGRLRRAGVSGSSLRSACPLAARRHRRNPAGSTPQGRSGLRWGSSGGGPSFPCPASSQAPPLKSV